MKRKITFPFVPHISCSAASYLHTICHLRYILQNTGTCRSPQCLCKLHSGHSGGCFRHIHQNLINMKERKAPVPSINQSTIQSVSQSVTQPLMLIRNPAHRSITKLRLGVHSLRIQTGKYENKGASIPVEERTCLICKRNCIEDERQFLMYCQEYDDIRHELHSLIYNNDPFFANLSDEDKIRYLFTLDKENTSKIVGRYIHLMLQKRKKILESKLCN